MYEHFFSFSFFIFSYNGTKVHHINQFLSYKIISLNRNSPELLLRAVPVYFSTRTLARCERNSRVYATHLSSKPNIQHCHPERCPKGKIAKQIVDEVRSKSSILGTAPMQSKDSPSVSNRGVLSGGIPARKITLYQLLHFPVKNGILSSRLPQRQSIIGNISSVGCK